MSAFVIDASITLSWLLADEANADSAEVERALRKADAVWAPAHWRLEVVNAIWMAERRKRLDGAGVSQAIAFCSQMQVTVDADTDKHATTETLALARQHGISVYDAAYLELALRKGGTLASLDAALREVAEKNGVTVVPR
jgi:predicted nucleic acid-binding protein